MVRTRSAVCKPTIAVSPMPIARAGTGIGCRKSSLGPVTPPSKLEQAAPGIDPLLRIQKPTKRFGNHATVDGLMLDVARCEFISLLGRSGCGKTTTLQMIGDFERPDAGTVQVDGPMRNRVQPGRGAAKQLVGVMSSRSGPLALAFHAGFIAFSLDGSLPVPTTGPSLRWFLGFRHDGFASVFWRSVWLGMIFAGIATLLCIAAALATARHEVSGKAALLTLFQSPLMILLVVLGIPLLRSLTQVGFSDTILGLVIAHVVIGLPFVLRTMLAATDRQFDHAAVSLDSPPFRVIWSLIPPGIAGGLVLALPPASTKWRWPSSSSRRARPRCRPACFLRRGQQQPPSSPPSRRC